MSIQISSKISNLYQEDFNLWLERMVDLLREGKLLEIDYPNLIEELESMGRSEKNALKSNLRILLMHLLKYQYQPQKRSNSWRYTISENRHRIADSLENSPSLRLFLADNFEQCYQGARRLASDETGLSLNMFPEDCPFLLDEVIDMNYLPD
ncbi:DUF29 domain-containing protein [Crocosphaera sp. UHCC 0190]|uniref:DUF29 domain-containing protein n=1 Tax=Crocosphaera sp. UHCC 0190 TaxID=3110246 RepID=UPI002B1F6BB1|nr:DUF29 domain-containing protein [Crocosphaera sp. UHCC 0190]MEA5509042.1 DUF29 domain-containing protein [Crocosphaera sp. UHCC 0190]